LPLNPEGEAVIYTIGLRDRYEMGFTLIKPFNKNGKGVRMDGTPYDGGWVWQTEADARAFIAANGFFDREVYGVLADWETGTEQKEGEPYRRLLRDSEMVKLSPAPDGTTGA
jgi:hypothetical protein